MNAITNVMIRESRGRFDTHPQKRKWCEDGDRDLNDVAISQGMLAVTRRNGFSPQASKKMQPCQHIDLTQRYCSGPSGVQNCKRINFYCAKPPSFQNRWQQSKETNIILHPLLPFLLALKINMSPEQQSRKQNPQWWKWQREKSKSRILTTWILASA